MKTKKVSLNSSGLVYAPGFIKAMRNDYDIGGEHKTKAIEIVAGGWFKGNLEAAEYVLANQDACTIKGDSVLVEGVPCE